MKKFTHLMMLVYLTQTSFSQQLRSPKKHISPQEYREKSGRQFVAGSILLAGGTTLAFVGANVQRNATGWDFSGIFIEAFGIVAAGGSIPLFISAINNNRKGKTITLNLQTENALTMQGSIFMGHAFPAVSVKISI